MGQAPPTAEEKQARYLWTHNMLIDEGSLSGRQGLENSINLHWRWHSRRELIQRNTFFRTHQVRETGGLIAAAAGWVCPLRSDSSFSVELLTDGR